MHTYENGISLDFWGNCDDIHSIVDMANDYSEEMFATSLFIHSVDENGCDFWRLYPPTPYLPLVIRPSDVSTACVRYVFYRRPDLFPVFMHDGEWSNGDNMTPELAYSIICTID